MNRLFNKFRSLAMVLAASAAMLVMVHGALADKIVLKNGTVIECEIVREDADVWVIKKPDGSPDYIDKATVRSVSRDADKPGDKKPEAKPADAKADKPEAKKDDAKKDEAKKDEASAPAGGAKSENQAKKSHGSVSGATRVAILNFGPPSSWQGKVKNMVGVQINAKSWRDAMPLLIKDNVDVVVVRINSGGGYTSEEERFFELFSEYKKHFRVVAWVESAISAAAMSPWVIEEFYMMPEGNIGACTSWSGDLVAVKGIGLAEVLHRMEVASKVAKRDPKIMRSMQIQEPLSCNIDENGNVTWFQDLSGQYLVNKPNEILTLNARDAVKFKFAKGIAATPEELAKVMGINEVEWAGKAATAFIDKNMTENEKAEETWQEVYVKYEIAVSAARQLADRERRLVEVGVAKRHLAELEKLLNVNPIFAQNLPPGWVQRQKELLKELAR